MFALISNELHNAQTADPFIIKTIGFYELHDLQRIWIVGINTDK